MSKFSKKYNGSKLDWFTDDLEMVKVKDALDTTFHFTNYGTILVPNAKTGVRESKFVMTVEEMPGKFLFANDIIGEVLQSIIDDGDYDESCSSAAPFQFKKGRSKTGNDYFYITFLD